ncbi:phage/plasmid primase, P4 family [Clostridium kluyveri]|uniref:Phage-related protein n=2 Tax=Clostridium kluyveri TaxID=1534 RepID=A5N1G1_CLOK5|nr:phage/plasmid primase, P4 family [Clostridium kluyveri]EDK34957.1 Phage-related protein [Clostridium kluyveri DSM 555]
MQNLNNNFDNIPRELREYPNWVLWKLESRKGKTTKIPYQIDGKMASSTNPDTWNTFSKVVETYNHMGKYSGIGFMFQDSGIVGIDIDDCVKDGEISEKAAYIIDTLDSYTELSQSGKGVHVLAYGYIPRAVKREIEMYNTGRYFALTGDSLAGNKIENRQKQLDAIYNIYQKDDEALKEQLPVKTLQSKNIKFNINELLDKAFASKNGFKIKALYDGSWQNLYNSQSEADQALANYLAFWLNKDPYLMDEAFRRSGLCREKWDRDDYMTRTINKAIRDCRETYQEYMIRTQKETNDFIKNYDFTDLGISKDFKNKYKDILKYAVDIKYYYYWDGKKWVRDDDGLPIKTLSIKFVENMVVKINQYISKLDDEKEIADMRKVRNKLKSARTLDVIYKQYKAFEDTHINSKIMDSDVRYINCNNGIVDITTGKILPHDKDLHISKIAEVNYVPGKINSLFKASIDRLFNGDNEEIEAFEILLGYMLSGRANQKIFPIIHGVRNTGKTQIFELILNTFGSDYVKSIDKSLLMKAWNKNSGANPELAELQGVRLLICSETSDSDYLDTDFMKKIVGGDTIKARPLYKPPIEFTPNFVPVIFTNKKPSFDGNDDALVIRIIVIELLYSLEKNDIDPDFKRKVLEDKEGLFSYIISCIVKFTKTGKLKFPQRWADSKEEYAKENNPYGRFKDIYFSDLPGHNLPAKEVYPIFEEWYLNEYSKNVPSRKKITQGFKALGIKTGMTKGYVTYKDLVFNIKDNDVNSDIFRCIKGGFK